MANQASGLTFQVLHNKANSINMKPELQIAHRLMMISVVSWDFKQEPPHAIFEVSPKKQTHCLGLFPNWDSRCAVSWDFPALFKSGCWSNPTWLCILCSFYFVFFFCFFFYFYYQYIESKPDNSLINIGIIYSYITSGLFC